MSSSANLPNCDGWKPILYRNKWLLLNEWRLTRISTTQDRITNNDSIELVAWRPVDPDEILKKNTPVLKPSYLSSQKKTESRCSKLTHHDPTNSKWHKEVGQHSLTLFLYPYFIFQLGFTKNAPKAMPNWRAVKYRVSFY